MQGQIMKFRRAEFLGFEFVSMVDELPIDDEDHFSSSYSIFELLLQSASPATAGFWPEEMCRYKIHIYGTDALRDKYISDEPLVYSLTCVFIFLFCAVIFFGFDFIVHRRQAKVMRTAKRANDIVVSLFPKTFRDRIYRQQQQSDVPNSAEEQNTAVLDSFLSSGQLQTEDTEATDPMADLFPSAVSETPLLDKRVLDSLVTDCHVLGHMQLHGLELRTRRITGLSAPRDTISSL